MARENGWNGILIPCAFKRSVADLFCKSLDDQQQSMSISQSPQQ